MVSRRIAAATVALGVLVAQPAEAGSLGFGLSVDAGSITVQPVFHERGYWSYRAAPRYEAPPRYAPALLQPRQIERLLRRDGYSQVEVVALEGPIYTVHGIDPWDNYVEMKVFGEDGEVLRSDPIPARLYDTPYAAPPPPGEPDRAYGPPADDGPRTVGALPQAPPQAAGQSEARLATAPLPRARPDHRPGANEPAASATAQSDPVTGETDERPGGRDPLVVY